jgi:hypothetical protein
METLAQHLMELCKTQLEGREWGEKAAWIEKIQKEGSPELIRSVIEDLGVSHRRSKRLRKN